MLDTQSGAILGAVSTELFAQVYFVTIRPESRKIEKEGRSFYDDHAEECRRLQRKAQLELAERVLHSSLRALYERPTVDNPDREEQQPTPSELRKFEAEFDEISRKYKEFATPGADLEALRTSHARFAEFFHGVWTGLVVLVAAVVYGLLWYSVNGPGPSGLPVYLALYVAGFGGFFGVLFNIGGYLKLRERIPNDETKLLTAIHSKVQFAEESSPPAEVPAGAKPTS